MNQNSKFQTMLEETRLIILDGGLATELEAHGHDLNTKLWSAGLLLKHPQAIIDAHHAYLNAGAQIITTATYQASIDGFADIGLPADKAKKLMLEAVMLARKAVTECSRNQPFSCSALIAASVGPYGAYLADGSEYSGRYQVNDHTLIDFHRPRLMLLDNSGADILGCETIPSIQEAQVLAELLNDVQTPAWVSFSCCDAQHLNDGTDIEQAAGLFSDHPKVLAIGMNCTAPNYISELVERIKPVISDKSIIVYPNSGELYDASSKSWVSTNASGIFSQLAHSWYQQGVQIIGGCCRIGPQLIKSIESELKS